MSSTAVSSANTAGSSGKSKYYAFNEANVDAGIALSRSGLLTGGEIPHGMPYFFNPILLSKNDEEGEKKIRVTVGPGKPVEESVHNNGIIILLTPTVPLTKVIGNVGDIHFNSDPLYLGEHANNLERDNVAWICTEAFQFIAENPTESLNAVWKPFWFINQ